MNATAATESTPRLVVLLIVRLSYFGKGHLREMVFVHRVGNILRG